MLTYTLQESFVYTMLEASRINYQSSHEVKEQRLSHAEPTPIAKTKAKQFMQSFAEFICTETGNEFFVGQILRYRVGKTDSLMENVYVFLNLILKTQIDFVYCREYGISLWPYDIGFQRNSVLEKKLEASPNWFFDDYISETTTFLVFHTDFRFPEVFANAFRQKFYRQSIHTLLKFGKTCKRLHLVKAIVRSSILMHKINDL